VRGEGMERARSRDRSETQRREQEKGRKIERERGVIDYNLYERTALSVIQSWLFTYSPLSPHPPRNVVRVAQRPAD
jgi:hypothetical protein